MAFARFAWNCDVYVYADVGGGFTCNGCSITEGEYRCQTAADMVAHLLEHRAKGERVPDDALSELKGVDA